MGRSQRHMLWEQGATAAGEIHAEGVVAPGIAMQVVPEALNELRTGPPLYNTGLEWKEPPDMTEVAVPIGEPGGPLSGSSLTGAIPEELLPSDINAPDVDSIEPAMISVNTPVQVTVSGDNFTEDSTVQANGNGLVSAYVSDTEMTADLPGFAVAQTLQITVTSENGTSAPVSFNVIAAERDIGPLTIARIDNADDGLLLEIDGGEFKVGDRLTVEATGNTSVNGVWTVVRVEGRTIVIDNDFELTNVIEAKGRVTVTAEA